MAEGSQQDPRRGIILPQPGRHNTLVTSALPYVNNEPHLGNLIGSTLSGDVFARYCRARGDVVLYVCGTDEYGTATEVRALLENCSEQELCDKYHAIHAAIYDWFNISFDVFGRTTTPLHGKITQDIFLKLNEQGFLKEKTTKQLYCEKHGSFLADRFVEGACPFCGSVARGDQCDCGRLLDTLDLKHPRCKIDGATPVTKETTHIFLALDTLQPEIEAFFKESSSTGAWSSNGIEITAARLKESLKPQSITRDIKWGTAVPLPGYEKKVLYTWFDAPIGYVSITANYTDQWEKWWRNPDEVQLYQFIGKDNVNFHSTFFPATQIGTRDPWTKVHHLSTTEYLNYEGGKFSKSRGVGVFGNSAQQTGIASDVFRFHLLIRRPETSDTAFKWDEFIGYNNNLLVKNLGNFVSRVLKFAKSTHFNNIVPEYTEHSDYPFETWTNEFNALLTQYIQALDAVKIRDGLHIALQISHKGNAFLQSCGLNNKLAENELIKCAAVVGFGLNLIHLLASLLAPYLPDTSKSINKQLHADALPIPDHWNANTIKPGHEIGTAEKPFSLIKPEKAEEWRELFGDQEAKKAKQEAAAKKASRKAAKQAARVSSKEIQELESQLAKLGENGY